MAIIPKFGPTSLNYAIAAGTTISSSSVNTAFPRVWLRDAMPTKPWRGYLGFTVYAGFNDKIRFKIGAGAPLIGTIVPGSYTGAGYAIAVQTALTNAGANAWIVGYTGSGVFTYDGTSDFTFQGTISEPATALPDMGLSAIADTVSSIHHINSAASIWKSREFIAFDFGAAMNVTMGIALNHNSGSLGTFTLQGKASASPWATPAFTQALGGDDLSRLRIATFAQQSYRYWALIIDDRSNTNGYSELGVVYVGGYWSPSRTYDYGFNVKSVSPSEIIIADQGAISILKKQSPRAKHIDFRWLSRADREAYQTIEDEHAHVFFLLNPTNYIGKDTMYGVIGNPANITDAKSPAEFFHLGFDIMENLG